MSLTKLSLGGNNDVLYKLIPPRQSLVSDITAGYGKIEMFLYGVHCSLLLNDVTYEFCLADKT